MKNEGQRKSEMNIAAELMPEPLFHPNYTSAMHRQRFFQKTENQETFQNNEKIEENER